jgi:predicted DNA-binding transcriptional regulator AlpA
MGVEEPAGVADDAERSEEPVEAVSLASVKPPWGARPTSDSGQRHEGFTPAQAGPPPTGERDLAGSMVTVVAPPPAAGRTITSLATLPGQTLLDEAALAGALGLSKRTVRRMVSRHELPPPFRFAGKSTWISSKVLAHVEAEAERKARDAARAARRLEELA